MSSLKPIKGCVTEYFKQKHIKYLHKHLEKVASSEFDSVRLTILFFVLSSLDLLKSLDTLSDDKKRDIIDWIYAQEINPSKINENNHSDDTSLNSKFFGKFGFRASPINGKNSEHDFANLSQTYSALACLLILGDDLSRLRKTDILNGLSSYQNDDGSFILAYCEHEDDLRVVYCAISIAYILNDFSTIDVDRTVKFIRDCLTYEWGFGLKPGAEAHGGSTFCALASLSMLKRMAILSPAEQKNIQKWLLYRQISGFQGRTSKDPDTCYGSWIGCSLVLLNAYQFVADKENVNFLDSTQNEDIGGFGKYPNTYPDVMHTFFGLSALALRVKSGIASDPFVQAVSPILHISQRAFNHLESLHI